MTKPNTIIFDLGNVLVDWNPKYVFNDTYFDSVEKRDYFLAHICNMQWHEKQDEGYSIVAATQELIVKYPEWEPAIRNFYGRWTDMFGGAIEGSVAILQTLKEDPSLKIYALTNWHHHLFDLARIQYPFMQWFEGIVVSGEEKNRKPHASFFQTLFDRYQVNPTQAVFIDDNKRNIEAAKILDLYTIHFTNPEQLKKELRELELL